jgi:methylene-tetrahydromethanopterin dehydrogenase
MEKPFILHMFTPTRNVSPFDVNMALDAGYQHVIPYTDVTLDMISPLTQDAIFSRGPTGVKRTGIFIGGREIGMAADMIDIAKRAMVPPFEVNLFADPSGAFTTAAAMIAKVEQQLYKMGCEGLKGRNVVLLGGTGPVGTAAAVLASMAGSHVRVASFSSLTRARVTAQMINARYGALAEAADASSADEHHKLFANAEVLLGTARAGVQVASAQQLQSCKNLIVAADLNAVPPAGIEGVGLMDDGKPVATGSGKTVGIGALAIGNVKYQVMRGLFEKMIQSDKPLTLDFRDAFLLARELV